MIIFVKIIIISIIILTLIILIIIIIMILLLSKNIVFWTEDRLFKTNIDTSIKNNKWT